MQMTILEEMEARQALAQDMNMFDNEFASAVLDDTKAAEYIIQVVTGNKNLHLRER